VNSDKFSSVDFSVGFFDLIRLPSPVRLYCMSSPQRDLSFVELSRDELYEKVWSLPGSKLAKQFGISDVALAKVCKKFGIPRPDRGYWARLEAGQMLSKPPLSPSLDSAKFNLAIFRIRSKVSFEPSMMRDFDSEIPLPSPTKRRLAKYALGAAVVVVSLLGIILKLGFLSFQAAVANLGISMPNPLSPLTVLPVVLLLVGLLSLGFYSVLSQYVRRQIDRLT
jgi:hypothetical protein